MNEAITLATLSEINPPTLIPTHETVSFVGMEDVSESFELITTHDRNVKDLGSGYTRFREGDLLFAKITPCMENGKGAVAQGLTNGLGMGSTEFHVLRPRVLKSRSFIAQWLASPMLRRAAEAQMTGSAGQRRVPKDFFERFAIPHLSVNEQAAVGEVLDALDSQMRSMEQIINKYRLQRIGLGEKLIAQEPPNTTLARALIGTPTNGIYKPAHLIGRGALLVGQTAINSDRRVIPAMARRAVVTSSEARRFGLISGDILVSRVFATLEGVGQPALVEHLHEATVYESNMMRLRCDHSKADSFFVFQTLLTSAARTRVARQANLSNQASISQAVLTAFPVWLPSVDQQLRISQAIRSVEVRINAEQARLTKLQAVKSGLMADLLTGRVRVPEGIAS